jgi:hypothetical protein
MASAKITAGPEKDELITLMLSNQPVTFLMAGGSIECLIGEFQEIDGGGTLLGSKSKLVEPPTTRKGVVPTALMR